MKLNEPVLELNRLGLEIDPNSDIILVEELAVDVLVDEGGLANA